MSVYKREWESDNEGLCDGLIVFCVGIGLKVNSFWCILVSGVEIMI